MIELLYAWRLLFGEITPERVPEPLRRTAVKWWQELSERIHYGKTE